MKREIDRDTLSPWIAQATECRNLVFQGLDLRPYDDLIADLPQALTPRDACVFFGCSLGPRMTDVVRVTGALVFPRLPGLPFEPFRSALYSPEELLAGLDALNPESYRETPDWRVFASFITVGPDGQPLRPIRFVPCGLDEVVARHLHDGFIHDELDELLAEWVPSERTRRRGVVAIMGGHDVSRSDPAFGAVARLARDLARLGFLVASGGGPGLMEAANLGAFFAPAADDAIQAALEGMGSAADYRSPAWLTTAWRARHRHLAAGGQSGPSLGIPTWFYGHEPPNVWATHIAKLFSNALREEGLLALATHGVVFGPGNAGTVQEIFQDACQNYYRTCGHASPMILMGRDFWNPRGEGGPTKAKPVWPLLQALAREGAFREHVHLTDDPGQVLRILDGFRVGDQER